MALTMADEQERAQRYDASKVGEEVQRIWIAELDATRARLAEVERKLEQKASWLKPYRDVSIALAAREAECAEMRAALEKRNQEANDLEDPAGIRYSWHHTPEYLRAILARPAGGNEALRAFAQKVADHAFDIHRNDGCGQCEAVDIAIKRLLSETPTGEREGK